MSKIYFYKLTSDDGGAPCVERGVLSLAICKPRIRKTASTGDILIGFAGKILHRDNRLIYIARVDEKLTEGAYYQAERYRKRSDCIYDLIDGRFALRPGAKYHTSGSLMVRDLGQPPRYADANVVLSRHFIYYGTDGPADYLQKYPHLAKAIGELTQGHRVHHGNFIRMELERLVEEYGPLDSPDVRGKPATGPNCHASHCGGGREVVVEALRRRRPRRESTCG